MHYNGDFIGTISLHNIRNHFPSVETLNLVGMSVAKCIHAYCVERGAEEKLYTDPLTGIPNFAALKHRAADLMEQNPDVTYFCCVMDVKFFSLFNRRYSYKMGDKVLITIAQLLKNICAQMRRAAALQPTSSASLRNTPRTTPREEYAGALNGSTR